MISTKMVAEDPGDMGKFIQERVELFQTLGWIENEEKLRK
jgi:hypothetical protein